MLHLRTNRRKIETSEEQDQYPLHTAHVLVIIWWQKGLPSGWDEQRGAQLWGEVDCRTLVRSWIIAEWPNDSYLISIRFLLCQMLITKYSTVLL